MGKIPQPPKQCLKCTHFNQEDMICKIFEELPGEGSRKDIVKCSSFLDRDNSDDLAVLAKYIQEDPDGIVEQRLDDAISKILTGYEVKFKITVIGIAKRKINSMIKMVDIIDIILGKLSDINTDTLGDLTPGQCIRLLSELNTSVNTDLAFIMKILQADSNLKEIQTYIDNRSININGASPSTELKADEILKMTGTSRDKIRGAFDAILNVINVPGTEEVYEPTEEESEDLESI